MARVAIPVTSVSRAGVAPPAQTDADATNKHSIAGGADGRTTIEVVSSDAGAQTVAFPIVPTVDGQAVTPRSVSIPAGATRVIGPFGAEYQQADGSLYVDPSVSTTLKFRAYRLP